MRGPSRPTGWTASPLLRSGPLTDAINHNSTRVQEYVRDVMLHWLRRGIDGWRLDAAYAVPAKFWAAALPAVREEFLDAWFVGEMITATTSTTWRRLAWTR